jgi:AraC-like DNA-binding protein
VELNKASQYFGYFFCIFITKYFVLKTFIPASKELQKYIEVFYVFMPEKPSQFSYIAFPHINTSISFFKGVSISRNNFSVSIEQQSETINKNCIEILGKYTKPVFVHYAGDFEEVSIVFKPLGANRFLKENFGKVAPEYSQSFNDEIWHLFSHDLFNEHENRIEQLENFLISQLNESGELLKMDEAINYFESTDIDYSIEKTAQIVGMGLKTFQRHFLKHLSCSPSEYKRIARFRNALNTKILSKEIKSLTSISYANNYSDQSYFIREFKKLTNLNPKKFFKEITVLDENKIIWELI